MSYEQRRYLMVRNQIAARGISDERVLNAMRTVPRHLFVKEDVRESAYDDCALPIDEGQTISQPYMVALMSELLGLKGDEKVLEIGTGSGYQSAVLSMLAGEVFTLERLPGIAVKAGLLLKDLGYDNVHAGTADGTLGMPDEAPFDGIIVTAAAPEVPDCYLEQLKMNGRLVIPVGARYSQILYRITKDPDGFERTVSTGCVFVPLIGDKGWEDAETC